MMFYAILILVLLGEEQHARPSHQKTHKRALMECRSMPASFARHWQVIGQKGRQIWISGHYLKVLGPVDDVFVKASCSMTWHVTLDKGVSPDLVRHAGKAAGGIRIKWYNIRCDDDMVQVKAVISESRSQGIGEYICIRLERKESDLLGYIVRETTKLTRKYLFDCEYWGDGSTRHAYMFHLTDTPTWVDLLTSEHSMIKASTNLEMKLCGEIPEAFHGEWKMVRTDRVVEIKSKFYRAYGAHGNDPFWRTNTEIPFFKLICNPKRIILKAYLWELPMGSRSQLQCLTLNLDGEFDLSGHAVNMVASKGPTNEPPEIDCDHGLGNDYTRYPLHLTRQIDESLAPQPIHNLAEHDRYEEIEDLQEKHHTSDEDHDNQDHSHVTADESGVHGSLDGVHIDTEPAVGTQHELPLVDTGHSDNHDGHDPSQLEVPDHHSLEEAENHHQSKSVVVEKSPHDNIIPTVIQEHDEDHGQAHDQKKHPASYWPGWLGQASPLMAPYQQYPLSPQAYWQPHMAYPEMAYHLPPNYPLTNYIWYRKRKLTESDEHVNKRGETSHIDLLNGYSDDYEDENDNSFGSKLLKAINSQSKLLKQTYEKLDQIVGSESPPTADWMYIPPYHSEGKNDEAEQTDQEIEKVRSYDYYGDD